MFVLDDFDLFASKRSKQTLLYNLLDALQTSGMQVWSAWPCPLLYLLFESRAEEECRRLGWTRRPAPVPTPAPRLAPLRRPRWWA